MDRDIACLGEDRRNWALIERIDGRDEGIEIAFPHSRDAVGGRGERQRRQNGGEAGEEFADSHGLHLAWRPGEQDDDAVVWEGDPLTGGGAAGVGENVCAIDDVGLPLVDLGHGATERFEARLKPIADGLAEEDLAVDGGGDGFACQVIFGGAEAAGEDEQLSGL